MNPLVASIINNPSAHQVNRADKMEATIDKMCDNLIKKEMQDKSAVSKDDKGYGQGRWMSD